MKQQNNQSKGPGDYKISNNKSCECGIPNVMKTALSGPGYAGKQFRDGFGSWYSSESCCVVAAALPWNFMPSTRTIFVNSSNKHVMLRRNDCKD